MSGTDPSHWLHRLSPDEWLAAAHTELRHAEETMARRAIRAAVTHARRAAGMAVNAVLVLRDDPRFGRSYMEHVAALASDEAAPAAVRAAARALREAPPAPAAGGALIALGKADRRALDAAAAVIGYARDRVASLRADS
jgi:HEPN domain-containing protein